MSKVTITLSTGSILEKPLITAFRGNSGEYIILDNEGNGTMGLPIILASKYENGRLNKIADPIEWGSVKEILRNIIAGNQMDYITVNENLTADADFFTQLTLPVASFESLKVNYKPVGMGIEETAPVAPAAPGAPVTPMEPSPAPVQPSPMDNVAPSIEPTPVAPMPEPIPNIPTDPIQPVNLTPMPNAEPAPVVTPVEQNEPTPPVAPVMPEPPMAQSTAPVVEPIPNQSNTEPDYSADKEAFLKACENMFDALVAKFNK